MLLLLSRFSYVWPCAIPETTAHQAPLSLGFRQEHWSGLPFPSPMRESEVAQSCPTLRDPMDCSLPGSSVHRIFQARVLEWGAIAFSVTSPGNILKSRDITLPAKVLLVKAMVFSVVMYGWRRQWHPTPVFLPAKSHGRRSLVSCSTWGREQSDTTEQLHFHFSLLCTGEGNGNPLQCSCLENPRNGGAWWAAIHGVTQSRTWAKQLSSSSSIQSNIVWSLLNLAYYT